MNTQTRRGRDISPIITLTSMLVLSVTLIGGCSRSDTNKTRTPDGAIRAGQNNMDPAALRRQRAAAGAFAMDSVDDVYYAAMRSGRRDSLERGAPRKADGKFFTASILMKNDAREPRTIAASFFHVTDDKGRDFTPSAKVSRTLLSHDRRPNAVSKWLLDNVTLDPGDSRILSMAFELPKDARNLRVSVVPSATTLEKMDFNDFR